MKARQIFSALQAAVSLSQLFKVGCLSAGAAAMYQTDRSDYTQNLFTSAVRADQASPLSWGLWIPALAWLPAVGPVKEGICGAEERKA